MWHLRRREPVWTEIFASPVRAELCTLILSYLYNQQAESNILPRDIWRFCCVLTAFTVLPGVSERSIHLQLPTMRSQISTDDGWDLIPFELAAQFCSLQPKLLL